MKKSIAFLLSQAAVLSAMAYSYVDPGSVVWTQPDGRNLVTIDYTLSGGPAVMTLDVLTNGVSIGAADLADIQGEVNKKVQPGTHRLTWCPDNARWKGVHRLDECISVKIDVWSANRMPDYMSVKCSDGTVTYYASSAVVPGGVTADTWKTTHILFARIPAANVTARLGVASPERNSTDWDANNSFTNLPAYLRTFTNDFYIAVYETTQRQYLDMCNLADSSNPAATKLSAFTSTMGHYSDHQTDWVKHPVTNVSYRNATNALERLARMSALPICLPTDEQWEFACRAGTTGDHHNGCWGGTGINDIAVTFNVQKTYYGGDRSDTTHPNYANDLPVGLKAPNAFGLYDMLGNVREICANTFERNATTYRAMKGGDHAMGWACMGCGLRAAFTDTGSDYRTGFRACCIVDSAD